MQRPVIGVTGNDASFSPSWICIRLSVWLAGGKAVRISTKSKTPIEHLDGLVISGGDDIHPSLFDSESETLGDYDIDRDKMEYSYISQGLTSGLPILGICRGHQLINVTLGGTLHQNIRSMRRLTWNRRGLLPTKTALLTASGWLAEIVGADRLRINSLHYQAIDHLADEFSIEARDLDGFCQSAACRSRNLLGVQWHPEYLFYLSNQRRLFTWLVETSRQTTRTKS